MSGRVSEHFTRAELACPTTARLELEPGFLDELEILRGLYGRPMAVTSGCRTSEHNEWLIARGYAASPNSLHLIDNVKHGTDTCAVDIRRPAGDDLADLVAKALNLGWTVGLAKTFVHLDRRTQFAGLPRIFYTY